MPLMVWDNYMLILHSEEFLMLELELYISIAQIKHNKHIECTLQYF